MKTAIRYYSKFGHTTKMANIVGELTNTTPELATVSLDEPVDTLYLGIIIKSPVPQMRKMLQEKGLDDFSQFILTTL